MIFKSKHLKTYLWASTLSFLLLATAKASSAKASSAEANPCYLLKLPTAWEVLSRNYADVTNDGSPECVLALWRPWKDWPIQRWSGHSSPIINNHDARGYSSHMAVLKPLLNGKYQQIWVGSALYRPILSAQVLANGQVVTQETTYQAGIHSVAKTLSRWSWTGFGFMLEQRKELNLP